MNPDASPTDYALLDSGDGAKLERFGRYVLSRPCAQAVWRPQRNPEFWRQAHAAFDREEGNRWHGRARLPETWEIQVEGIRFNLSGTDFGHLGLFPEQRAQWAWIQKTIGAARAKNRPVRVLNLFAYSGGSTLASALAGAEVCHVDASKGMIQWARDNAAANGLADHPIRWIVDDAHQFMNRELRRDKRYDGIILDPPTFGRGRQGELYKIERDLPETLRLCRALLTDSPLFMLLSAHTPGYSPVVMENVLRQGLAGLGGAFTPGEMLLTGDPDAFPLPSGAFVRWEKEKGNGHG